MPEDNAPEVNVKAKSLNIKQIRYFAAVVELGSLSAAAKDQFVTVQAVSKAIADLEHELDHQLFVRESRGVRATPFGTAFYQRALSVLRDFDDLEAFSASYEEVHQPGALRLALCVPPFVGHERACASIAAFAKRGLGVETTVGLETGEGALSGLCSDEYDAFIVVGPFSHPEVDCMPVGTVSPGVQMIKSHPLASLDAVSLDDLKPYPASLSAHFETFNEAIAALHRKRNLPVPSVVIDSTDTLIHHYLVDQGVCFIVRVPALGEMFPGTAVKPLVAADTIAIPICLVSLKSRKTPAYRAFEHWLATQLALMAGVGAPQN